MCTARSVRVHASSGWAALIKVIYRIGANCSCIWMFLFDPLSVYLLCL
uniref:Uncharacterized protein n=1 Tax=Arundo donax TaxID=35708 RepID=A0A0A8ZRP9_ARUDO